MTNAFTIPEKSTLLQGKGRLTFVSKTRARPKTMWPIAMPGSSKAPPPALMRPK